MSLIQRFNLLSSANPWLPHNGWFAVQAKRLNQLMNVGTIFITVEFSRVFSSENWIALNDAQFALSDTYTAFSFNFPPGLISLSYWNRKAGAVAKKD